MIKQTILLFIVASFLITLTNCAGVTGRGSSGHYGYRHGPSWYDRDLYRRDRVHVVSEAELREIERLDSESLPEPPDPGPDMGFGGMDMDMGGGDFDF